MNTDLLRRADVIAEVERRTGRRLRSHQMAEFVRFGTLPVVRHDECGRQLFARDAIDHVVTVVEGERRGRRK